MSENYQSNVISEIIETERSYLLQLEKLQNYFSKPSLERGILPSHAHSAIFSQLSAIYQMNSKLLEEILDGKENIGSAFLKLGPFLKVYSSYANNFQRSLIVLQEWESKNEEFKSFVSGTETRPEVQTKLTSLLITPIQRIPRYRLLLGELLKHSDTNYHTYNDVQGALRQVTEVAEHINQSVDDSQALTHLLLLQKALKNQQPSIIAPGRKLIKEGLLNKVSRKGNGSQARLFFLFSDMLMYTKVPAQVLTHNLTLNAKEANFSSSLELDLKPSSLDCCCVLPLRYCKVTTLFGAGGQGITFRLQCSDEDLLLYSRCASEGEGWVSAIRSAAQEALNKRKTLRKASSRKKAVRKMRLRKFTYSEDEEGDRLPEMEEEAEERGKMRPKKCVSKTDSLKCHLRSVRECLTPPKKTFGNPKRQPPPNQSPLSIKKQLSPQSNCNFGVRSQLSPQSNCNFGIKNKLSPQSNNSNIGINNKLSPQNNFNTVIKNKLSPQSNCNIAIKNQLSRQSNCNIGIKNQLSPQSNTSNTGIRSQLSPQSNTSPCAIRNPLSSQNHSNIRVSPKTPPGGSPPPVGTPTLIRFHGDRQSHRTPPPISPLATCSWERGSTPRNSSRSFVFRNGVRGREGSQLTPSPSPSSAKGKKRPLADILTPPWGKAFKKD